VGGGVAEACVRERERGGEGDSGGGGCGQWGRDRWRGGEGGQAGDVRGADRLAKAYTFRSSLFKPQRFRKTKIRLKQSGAPVPVKAVGGAHRLHPSVVDPRLAVARRRWRQRRNVRVVGHATCQPTR